MLKIRNTWLLMILALAVAVMPGCGSDDPTGPGTSNRGTILVLGDGGTEDHVMATLKDAGFTVRDGGIFHEYTGENLQGTDAVVLLVGVDYNHDMTSTGQNALSKFVSVGGGLLTTEWMAFGANKSDFYRNLRHLLPVQYGDSYATGSETYSVLMDHAITKGLAPTFATGPESQYSVVKPNTGATTLIRGDRSGPAVVTWRKGGRVVSWNMAGEYAGSEVWTANMDRLLSNSVGYIAGEGTEPLRNAEFRLETGFMNVTHDGDSGSQGDFYITMEIFDASAGPVGEVLAQDRTLVQVSDGRVISPGLALAGEVPILDGREVLVHISIYENDPGGPQDLDVYEASFVYNFQRDCWIKEEGSFCSYSDGGTLRLRNEPGESDLHCDLNWDLRIER